MSTDLPSSPSQRGFLGHLVAQAAGAMNDNLFRQAFLAAVTITAMQGGAVDGDAASMDGKSTLALVFILPFLLLAPLAGRLADSLPKHRLIQGLRLAEIGLVCVGGLALWTDSYALMLVAIGLLGVQSALFSPVKMAVVPELVADDDLERANGWLTGSTYLAIMVGTGLAFCASDRIWEGTLFDGIPGALILWIVGLAISLTGFFGSLLLPRLEVTATTTVRARFRDQFAALATAPGLWQAAIALGSVWGIGLMAQLALSGIAVGSYGLDESGAALIALVPGLGIAFGATIAPRLSNRAYPGGLPLIGALIAGTGMLFAAAVPAGLVPTAWMASVLEQLAITAVDPALVVCSLGLLLAGIGIAAIAIPLAIFLQHHAPSAVRGRVFAASGILSIIAILSGIGIARLQGDSITTLATAGAIAITAAVTCMVSYRFHLFTWLVTIVARVFYKVDLSGVANLPKRGGCLIICNHLSYVDGILLFASLPRQARFLVFGRYVAHPIIGMPLRAAGVIPVGGSSSRQALVASIDAAVAAAEAGEVVVIFPEGKLTRSGQMDRFQAGMERIAKRAGVPVIPAFLHGLLGSLTSRAGFYKCPYIRRPVSLRLGAALPEGTSAQEARAVVQSLSFEDAQARSAASSDTLASAAIRMIRRNPRQIAVTDSGGSLPRWRLGAAAHALRGVWNLAADEGYLGILLPPGRAGALVNLAAAMDGRTAVNLNHTVGDDGLAVMTEVAGIRTTITSKLYHRKIGAPALSGTVLYIEDLLGGLSTWRLLRSALAVMLRPLRLLCNSKPDDVAALVFSSGSTSTPKGIQLTHRQLLANINGIRDHLGLHGTRDVLLAPLPVFHSFGLTAGTWLPMIVGLGAANHPDPTDGKAIGALAEQTKATFLVSTPTFIRGWMRRIEPEQFAHLRFGIVGAEKCPDSLREQFRERYQAELLEGYGATELGPVATISTMDVSRDGVTEKGSRPGSVGRPLPGIDIFTVDPDSHGRLPVGSEGLLIIRSTARMAGYLNQPELTAKATVADGYNTGDIGKVDRDGFVYLTGRQARFAKIGGEMVPLDKVQEVLLDLLPDDAADGSQALAVAAVPDDRRGERLIVLHTGLPIEAKDLLATVGDALPPIFTPKAGDFHQVDALPVLGTGKLDLKGLKELAATVAGSR